jgi:hypothetical protein
MLKFLLNLLLQISKALINSKIQFLIRKFLFPDFRPGRPRGPLGLWPRKPTGHAVPAGRNRPACPSSPRVGRVFTGNTFSSSVHAFPSRLPPPRSLTTGPHFSASSSPPCRPTPAVNSLHRHSLRRPLRASSFPPLIPFKPSLNEP